MSPAERNSRPHESAAHRLAAEQLGLIASNQAKDLGFSSSSISRRVAAGRWEPVLPRVYRIVGAPHTGKQAALAAILWARNGAVVSHATAGVLHGIEGLRTRRVEITVPRPRDLRSDVLVVHRSERLDRADRMMLGPIPITTPTRTLIDVSRRLPDDRLLAAVESAFRLGLATPERLGVRIDALRSRGRPGLGRLATILERRGKGVLDTRLEAKVWLLVTDSDLPRPIRQHWVVVGGRRYHLDFAWPEHKVGLESDGWIAHSGLAAFESDRERMSELVAAGWRILLVTWDRVSRDPDRVVGWVRESLRRAAA